ncbi:hypothetical protein A4X09_0g390 [Tilletia walkeri]|uniref:WLM domain-containing protein n=1 Tax=Tilletia walkeri TaxID=117179 RepID=A0A8X7NFE6_9BASI|nr:hypothetical protein A4X09_0g390 [Tilletia walkeri]
MPVEGRGPYRKPAESHRFVESIATSGPHGASSSSAPGGGGGPFIAEYRALNRKGSEQCLQILRRIGTLVKPLMVKHGWRLPLLAEFYPTDKRLLGINVNGGQKICLRLRAPHNPEQIWDEHVVMGTMLHELTHNVRGPHDSVFYAFLDKLKDEYQSIRISGWSGEGFLVPGRTLGRALPQQITQGMHTAIAAAMAEERRRRALLGLDSAPRRLGGAAGSGESSSSNNRTPAQRAADAAATRRAQQDDAQCPNASAADLAQVERETDEREEREGVEIVEVRPGGREAEEDRAAAEFVLQKVVWNAEAGPSSSVKQEVKVEPGQESASVPAKRSISAAAKGRTPAEAITIGDDSSSSSVEEGGDGDEIQVVATKIKRKPPRVPPPDTRTPLQRSSQGEPSMKLLKPVMWKRLQAEAENVKSSSTSGKGAQVKGKQKAESVPRNRTTNIVKPSSSVNVTGANVKSAEAAAGLALGLQAGWIGPNDLSQSPVVHSRPGPSSPPATALSSSWSAGAEWTCQTCTLVNGSLSEVCAACSAPHPAVLSQLFG